MTAKQPTLTVDGVTLRLEVARKKVKNINVRLVGDELRVSAPRWVSARELDEAVDTLARRLVRRERARKINGEDNALELARRVARRFPDPPPEVAAARFSTRQGSRWGSYSTRTRTVHLNAAIRLMPSWVLEAVVAHELAHVCHPDHSPAFWALLREVCPQTDRARAFLEGVAWFGRTWESLPPVERSLLISAGEAPPDSGADDRG
ncbi:MAG: M48 family metallopeptidase [Candidatus Sulfomarinibacteraceae bacterium]